MLVKPFKDNDRVVFFGDSITHNNHYIMYIYSYYRKHFPNLNIRFYNSGIAGATLSTGFRFYDEDLKAWNPNVVVMMYGMNDSQRYYLDVKNKKVREKGINTAFEEYKVNLDKKTDYNTYTVAVSGKDIKDFLSDYSTNYSKVYFGIYCPETIGKNGEQYEKALIYVDNFKIEKSEIPENYVPLSEASNSDVLDYDLKASYGEDYYSLIDNLSIFLNFYGNKNSALTILPQWKKAVLIKYCFDLKSAFYKKIF